MLTLTRLKDFASYDAETGLFIRNRPTGRWDRFPAGTVIGKANRLGYIELRIDGKLYRAHRLAWFYCFGQWPKNEIDHINGNPSDNRIANLREATRSQNGSNLKLSKANTSGLKGVHLHKPGVWRARIAPRKKSICLGLYDCPAAAHFAYVIAAKELFGEFSRTG